VFGGDLSRSELEEVRARIEASPHLWVGQERLDPSTVPTLVDGRLVSCPVTVRAFLVAHQGSYELMAGGLVRVLPAGNSEGQGARRLSKDTGAPSGPTSRQPLDALLDGERPASVVVSLRALVDAAFSVQEQLSGDTWRVIADVEAHLAGLAAHPPETLLAAQADLTGLTRSLLALAGLTVESMVRDTAWRFLDGGRRLERGLALVSVLRTTLVPSHAAAVETLMVESVLKAFESIIDYRRRFRGPEQVCSALEQLLFDPDNPRSLRYQLDRLAEDLARLPRANPLGRLNPEERWVLDAGTALQLADPAELAAVNPESSRRTALDEFLLRLGELLGATNEVLGVRYFSPPPIALLAEPRGS
jgi:uncharacterized alpha-E superfamily protein